MSTPATEEVTPIPNDASALTEPTFIALVPTSLVTCDRHTSAQAVVHVTLPSGGTLDFCGACGRANFGYEHTKSGVKPEDRLKGSAN